jgi:hypothetical protein
MIKDEWQLAFVTSADESTGKCDTNGTFITHNIFKNNL